MISLPPMIFFFFLEYLIISLNICTISGTVCTETFCVSVCAEGSGADAEVADSQGCWPRVLVSSRYPSLLFVTVVALNKTHKQDTKSHKPISLSVADLT